MSYKDIFQCFSFACSDIDSNLTEKLKFTNKVLLPPEILNNLVNENGDSEIEFPLFFFIENTITNFKCICSVHEFTAPPGICNIPYRMLEDLSISEGEYISIELTVPITGNFIKIRPHKTEFIDLPDPRGILEKCFTNDYQVISNFSTISIFDEVSNKSYFIDIIDTQPSDFIKFIDTDIEVEFSTPLDYIEAEPVPLSNSILIPKPQSMQTSITSENKLINKNKCNLSSKYAKKKPNVYKPFSGKGDKLGNQIIKK